MKRGIWTKRHIQGQCHLKMKAEWGDGSRSQGTPKSASKLLEARGEVWKRFVLMSLRRKQQLDLGLRASRTGTQHTSVV